MNTEQIERAEQLIREEKAQEAYELLLSLAKEDPENGRIAFSLGNVLLMSGLAEQSVICFRQAIRRGYDHAEVYINMASALEQSGRAAKVPGTLKTAAEKTEDARKKRIIEIMLSYYYLRNDMLLQAEREVKKVLAAQDMTALDPVISEGTEGYIPWHLLFRIYCWKKKYDEAQAILDNQKTLWQRDPFYQMDRVEMLELQGEYSRLRELLLEDPLVKEVVPHFRLQKLLHQAVRRQNKEESIEWILRLLEDFRDMDAALVGAAIAISAEQYEEALAIVLNILEEDENGTTMRFRFATILLPFLISRKSGGHPDRDQEELKIIATERALEYVEELGGDRAMLEKAYARVT